MVACGNVEFLDLLYTVPIVFSDVARHATEFCALLNCKKIVV